MEKLVKKLRALSKIIFGRTAIVAALLIMQIALFAGVIQWLSDYSTLIYIIFILISAGVVIYILNDSMSSSFKLAWIIPVLLLPIFGSAFFIFMNNQFETRLMRKRLKNIGKQITSVLPRDEEAYRIIQDADKGEKGLADYLYNYADTPAERDNNVKYFPIGEDYFKQVLFELKNAEKFIFLEYFIVAKGYMWDTILEILKQKVKEGVEVRFMYDGMCSIALLPYNYYKEMESFGIKCRPFAQIRPALSTCQNNRDHRKILVVDGRISFTGGVNFADEYINMYERFGHWKDVGICVEGSAVKNFTLLFLKMWHVAGKSDKIPTEDIVDYVLSIDYDKMKPGENEIVTDADTVYDMHRGGIVVPYGDDPIDEERVGEQVYIDILNRAEKYVHIMTPYLILDDEVITALKYCAKRGVETSIIMPHIPDKMYAYMLARTYYEELIENGVNIYEYIPGFVHAKVFVSDDKRASVGTINLDYRSLYLHFECSTYIYNNDCVFDINDDYVKTLEHCHKITMDDCKNYSKMKRFVGGVLRLFAPLM